MTRTSRNTQIYWARLIQNINISEGLTKVRVKLLGFLRNLDLGKDAFTRNGVIHALAERSKVLIDTALDLNRLGIYDIPFESLGISTNVNELGKAPAQNQARAEWDAAWGDGICSKFVQNKSVFIQPDIL